MNKTIIKAPCVNLTKMESLFIEMTAKNCNMKCKHCYISVSDKTIKDFIPIEKIKTAMHSFDKSNLKFIHLSGAEPMLHPDFNLILRYCLKFSSVVIHTNAMSINDKKARFLRKVEEENGLGHEIIFMLSLDHYIEKENDLLRGRGSFRKTIHAIQSLVKYEFNPILSIINFNNIDENELKQNFAQLCSSIGFETTDLNFKIIPYLDKNLDVDIPDNIDFNNIRVDCSTSRTLTLNGVFTCPLLSSDNRGKCGSDFTEFSTKNYLETSFCAQCVQSNKMLFSFSL